MVSRPSYDPNRLSAHDAAETASRVPGARRRPGQADAQPRARRRPTRPGRRSSWSPRPPRWSRGQYTPDTVIPAPAELHAARDSTADLKNCGGQRCGPNGKITLDERAAGLLQHRVRQLGVELGGDALREQAEKFGFNTSFQIPMRAGDEPVPGRPRRRRRPRSPRSASSTCGDRRCRWRWSPPAIANGGELMQPYMVDKQLAPDLRVLEQTEPEQFEPGRLAGRTRPSCRR